MDFTLNALKKLLKILRDSGYSFVTVKDFAAGSSSGQDRMVIIRHDVDRLPSNALACARMEAFMGIPGTYYFRITPGSFDSNAILEIASMGHEIGYHYEDLDLAAKRHKSSPKTLGSSLLKTLAGEAYESFARNLQKMRSLVAVNTACMHGSPMSQWDSRQIWRYYDYKELGIICEPYFDIKLDNLLYITDTGRRWNGSAVSLRDRIYARDAEYYSAWVRKPVIGSAMAASKEGLAKSKQHVFRKTGDIVKAVGNNCFPQQALITCHPQRWSLNASQWISELISQKIKNGAKFFLVKDRTT